jgi:hypothetical protein
MTTKEARTTAAAKTKAIATATSTSTATAKQLRGSLYCAAHDETVNSFGRDDAVLVARVETHVPEAGHGAPATFNNNRDIQQRPTFNNNRDLQQRPHRSTTPTTFDNARYVR